MHTQARVSEGSVPGVGASGEPTSLSGSHVSKALVDWGSVESLVGQLAELVPVDAASAGPATVGVLAPLIAPYLLLEDLHRLASRSLLRDRCAQEKLTERLDELLKRRPDLEAAGKAILADGEPNESPCGARHGSPPSELGEPILRFEAVSELLVAAAKLCSNGSGASRAVLAVLGLLASAATLERLRSAHAQRGPEGLVDELNWLAGTRFVREGEPPVMRTMMGGMPGAPGLPTGGQPGLGGGLPPGLSLPPGLGRPPAGPGGVIPPSGPPDGGLPDFLGTWLKKLREKRWWDPEIWDHRPIIGPPSYDYRTLRCAIALGKLVAARLAKPARPAKVVWSDNITAIHAPNPCAGALLRIEGHGFGKPRPPNIGLMLPLGGECTPWDFTSGTWTDTRIEITMPVNITSGPIGFVDLSYVAAYNAWADAVNNAILNLKLAGCGSGPVLEEHFHECPPATSVNALAAGAAFIQAFLVEGAADAVMEPGQVFTLSWDVVNSTNVQLERVGGSGPLLQGATVRNGLPEVGSMALTAAHAASETWRYRLTATGRCGNAVAEIVVHASKQPQLRIESVEVTQGLQTIPPTMELVAGKATVVRVSVRHGLGGWGGDVVPGVRGRLQLRYGASSSVWLDPANGSLPMAPTPGASISVVANPQRQNTNDTLNFLVPGALCTGTPSLRIEVTVDGFDARPGFAGFTETTTSGSTRAEFKLRRTLELRFVRTNWNGTVSSAAECDKGIRDCLPMIPTPNFNVAPANVGVLTAAPGAAADMFEDLLDQVDELHNCDWWESLTEWLGSDCPDDDGAIWVAVTTAVSGGLAQRPGNCMTAGTVFVSTMAHEMSHNLDQRHLTSTCTGGGTPENADDGASWPNAGQIADVPFDITTNAALQSATGLWDIMTYCNRPDRWPTALRWSRLWSRVGA